MRRCVAGLILAFLLTAGLALADTPVRSPLLAPAPPVMLPADVLLANPPPGAAEPSTADRAPDVVDRCDACSLRHKARAPQPSAKSPTNQ